MSENRLVWGKRTHIRTGVRILTLIQATSLLNNDTHLLTRLLASTLAPEPHTAT